MPCHAMSIVYARAPRVFLMGSGEWGNHFPILSAPSFYAYGRALVRMFMANVLAVVVVVVVHTHSQFCIPVNVCTFMCLYACVCPLLCCI